MQRSSMAADASADDNQIIIERFGRSSIAYSGSRDFLGMSTARDANSARTRLSQGGEPEGFPPESTEAEIHRLG